MIALDTNIIIHLLVKSQREHERAKAWLVANTEVLCTTHTNMGEVLRLLTHPRVFPKPLRLKEAVCHLKEFVEVWNIHLLEEAPDWWHTLMDLTEELPALSGNEVFDARIALCLQYNGVKHICTLDTDFSKYKFLKMILV